MAHDDDGKEYASKGVAGAGLGLGIAGTALALLGGNDAGIGLFNRGGYHNGGFGRAATGAAVGFEVGYAIENERRMGSIEAQLAGLRVGEMKDAQIASLETQLGQANMLRYVDDRTCGMIKGQNLIAPNQIGDPYMGQRMVIATHPPYVEQPPVTFGNRLAEYTRNAMMTNFVNDTILPRLTNGNGCECKDYDRWY